jgi:hypothetical protein
MAETIYIHTMFVVPVWRRFYPSSYPIVGAEFGRPAKSFFFFQILDTGCHWEFAHCHMAASHSATSSTTLSTYHVSATSSYRRYFIANSPYHVTIQTVWTSTWKNPIGPWIDPKVPKMGDTWEPPVLPRHHVDIKLTST